MKKVLVGSLAIVLSLAILSGCGSKSYKVGTDIGPEKFREFYYTYSTTTYPPKFQRYRFYLDGDTPMFYHEKREGDAVFLTEDDITLSGQTELSPEVWDKFWDLIAGGTVSNRDEEDDTSTGNPGPWMYLYWDGDQEKMQMFTFADPDKLLEFEEFCLGI